MSNKLTRIALVCFFELYPVNNGASEVIVSLYNCLKAPKKIFYIKSLENKIYKLFNNITLNYLNFFYKILSILKIFFLLKRYFYNKKKTVIFVEGASWIGFSFLLIFLAKRFIKDCVIIYHSHNIEYDLRKQKKSSFLICILTKFLEKIVFKISDYKTVVSEIDQKRVYNLYKIKPLILENGIDKNRLKINKKFNHPNEFIIFSGSYEFFPNQQAINKLTYRIMPNILKKYPRIKLIITGKGLPDNIKNKKFIIYYNYLPKNKLIYLIKKSRFVLFPFKESPGTKLKVIESLMLGSTVISTKDSLRGISYNRTLKSPIIYKNYKDMYAAIDKTMYSKINTKIIKKFYTKKFSMQNIFSKLKKEQIINVF